MSRVPEARPRAGVLDESADRRAALGLVPVSRETERLFSLYADLLQRWQAVKNLVGPSTLPQVWTRHFADSAQLLALAPSARHWADMGSGAGFPGLVIAVMIRDRPGAAVHLIESNGRKCAFLREVVRAMGAPAEVHNARVEDVIAGIGSLDVVTSRALAPLPRLLELGKIPLAEGASGLFLKSADDLSGLGPDLPPNWSVFPSKTSPKGRIIRILPEGGGRPLGANAPTSRETRGSAS